VVSFRTSMVGRLLRAKRRSREVLGKEVGRSGLHQRIARDISLLYCGLIFQEFEVL
jgi:hypothetical protein